MVEPIPIKAEPVFADFWARYPRKVDKALTKAKWDKITNGGLQTRMMDKDSGQYVGVELCASPREIMAGLERYWDQIIREDTPERFICHPATWLNRGRWMD